MKIISNIAGYQKISFLDYPGIPSAIIFFSGCNMDCPYCHNKDIAKNKPLFPYSAENIVKDLKASFKGGWIKGVVITGGEPSIHEDEIIKLLDMIRNDVDLWWNFKIKLDTNGSNPSFIKLIKMYIDYIAMDIKKPFPKNNSKISESVDIIMKGLEVDYEFRTTVFPPWINKESIEEIGSSIKGAKLHCIQQYKKVDDTLNIEPYDPYDLIKFKTIMDNYVDRCEIKGL